MIGSHMTKTWIIMCSQWSQRAKKLIRVPINPIKYLKTNPVATHFKVLDQVRISKNRSSTKILYSRGLVNKRLHKLAWSNTIANRRLQVEMEACMIGKTQILESHLPKWTIEETHRVRKGKHQSSHPGNWPVKKSSVLIPVFKRNIKLVAQSKSKSKQCQRAIGKVFMQVLYQSRIIIVKCKQSKDKVC